jgi:pSer/pThr/pTyr-binding forkhead associated (FHA) protein
MSGDHITIIEPNGVQRARPITPQGLTIGRGNDNDLVITYAAVSRNHAMVTFDRGHYYVTDMNSANGTYLGKDRLEPNTPTVWTPGTPLRIGDVLINLVSTNLEKTASAGYKPETRAEAKAKTEMETFVGVLPEEAQKQKGKGRGCPLMGGIIALVVILVLVALDVTAHYLLFRPL